LEKENIEKLKELINLFEHNIKQYKGKHYDEAKTRVDFIDKFFELLGWDIRNIKEYSEQYRDVVREDRIEIKGKVKAPDYSFRIGGFRKFFVEAKKPSVNIKHDIEPAFQLRRYAYTAKLPLSILTDFEEFAVYDTRIKPDKRDQASTARIFYCTYEEYEKEFDFIFNTFSRQAILKGSFDQYIEDTKRKKGTSEVDKEFLKFIEKWRENLAKNIALRNKNLTIYELNYAVQKIIDRIIFLRIAEDRHVEDYGKIQKLLENKKTIYPQLVNLFLQADVKYDSGLFNFKADQYTPELKIDDKILKDIIKSIYYPDSPYEFSVFDVEILGNIYEQFLGKTIRLTASHQAKIENKPEVKKAGGVYYTPKYIVDYIVKNTVGEKIKNKTPDQISKLKILDPACGSGSFLLGAYQKLMNYHLEYYTKDKNIKKSLKDNKIYQIKENECRLTIEEKHKILLNNIFGVDIDSQAVEVTKLSLLLKLMEGESQESAGMLFKFSDIKMLPDLSENIKCGNSLIGSDFYDSGQMSLFQDEETTRRINVFDWHKEFPDIFTQGGFDIVIGNPPYIRQEMLTDYKDYFSTHYQVYHGVADLYAYFIEKGCSLLKENGFFSFIVSNRFAYTNYGENLRDFISKKNIKILIDFNGVSVFPNANVDTLIFNFENNNNFNNVQICNCKTNFNSYENFNEYISKNCFYVKNKYFKKNPWSFNSEPILNLKFKIIKVGKPLNTIPNIKIKRGITTGANDIFIINNTTKNELIKQDNTSELILKPILKGADIKKWYLFPSSNYLIYSITGIDINKYDIVYNYLEKYKKILENVWEAKHGKKKWYELRGCNYYEDFSKEKIIYTRLSNANPFSLSLDGEFCLDSAGFIITNDNKYYLGILNSKLILFYFKLSSVIWGKDGVKWFGDNFDTLPIKTIDLLNSSEKFQHDKMVKMVDQMLEVQKKYHSAKTENEKTIYKKQIDILDNQIDKLVYKLYKLTKEEIKVIGEKNE